MFKILIFFLNIITANKLIDESTTKRSATNMLKIKVSGINDITILLK